MIDGPMTDERIRLREEVRMQIRALKEMASMAAKYGCDITRPAENAPGGGAESVPGLPGGGEGK